MIATFLQNGSKRVKLSDCQSTGETQYAMALLGRVFFIRRYLFFFVLGADCLTDQWPIYNAFGRYQWNLLAHPDK